MGAYFVTICVRDHRCLFGDVEGVAVRLSEAGRIAEDCWLGIPGHFPMTSMDTFIVMPNHIHGILVLDGRASQRIDQPSGVGAAHASPRPRGAAPQSVGAIVASYKSAVSKQVNALCAASNAIIWQRNYYEHIIRSEDSLNRIRQYILDNPIRWTYDRENQAAAEPEPANAWAQ